MAVWQVNSIGDAISRLSILHIYWKTNVSETTDACLDTTLGCTSIRCHSGYFVNTDCTDLPVDDFFGSKNVYGLCLNVKSNRYTWKNHKK